MKNNSSAGSVGLKQQTFGQPDVVQNYSTESQKYLRSRLPVVQRSLQLYLANRETEFILFRLYQMPWIYRNVIVTKFFHTPYFFVDQLRI